jgi:hypothetical protein
MVIYMEITMQEISTTTEGLLSHRLSRDKCTQHQDSGSNPLNCLPFAEQAAFNASDKQHDPLCLQDTRVEVLAEIRAWVHNVEDEKCVFWLSGMAGTGKSTIARTIARELHDSGHLGASFFFSRGGGDTGHAGLFVTTIARQLAASGHLAVDRKQVLRASISNAVSGSPDIALQSRQEQWKVLVVDPISQLRHRWGILGLFGRMIWPRTSPWVLVMVLDALDECEDENDIKSILQLLVQAGNLTSVKLRILVTSRPEMPIYLGLHALPAIFHRQVILDDISRDTINRDIRAFFESNFALIRTKHGALATDWPGDDNLEILVQRADALFIYAATVCRFLSEDERASEERLKTVLQQDAAYHRSLSAIDDIYTKVLQRAVPYSCDEDVRTKLQWLFDNVIKPVVVLLQPLSVRSLADLMQVGEKDVDGALRDLRSVLYLPADQGSAIRLLHPSFREFLLEPQRCTNPHFAIDERLVHYTLFVHCFRVMTTKLKQYMCSIRHPGYETTRLDKQTRDRHIPSHLRYACRYWVTHLLRSDRAIEEVEVVVSFFNERLLSWLETLGWIGRVAEAVQMVTDLEISVVSKSQSSMFCTQLTCTS